ncbi:diguanylate cyclase domain-containing protein [Baaleninema simplex]|uniref:diguanylate cyclase domain-containing protein n=1 Tax=Baaleninema simplex TaxID=2862350 RepID=UPI000345EECB|nr:diguanylate cyclase [Baaleninema simplex]
MNSVDLPQTTPKTIQADILVVDDTPANLTLLRQMLSARGYRVRVSRSGELALKSALSRPPDLVLLDIKMPDMDGYAVCRALKDNHHTRDVPIVFLSVVESISDKVEAFRLGGADYITKPFQSEEVLARVEHQLLVQRQKIQLEREIRDRQRVEAVLRESRALLSGVLNSSIDGVSAFRAVRDRRGHIIDFQWLVANPVAAQAVETTPTNLVGRRLLDVLPEYRDIGLFENFVSVVETGQSVERELYYDSPRSSGWWQVVAVKLGNGLTVTVRNITERKQMELALQAANVELQDRANHDGLTELANRRRFDEYWSQMWDYCARHAQPLSLILIDVDRFKAYNDTYGHQAGDLCLQKVAGALQQSVTHRRDLVARYGGEEFAVVLPQTEAAGAIRVAQRLRSAVRQLRIPHQNAGIEDIVTVSLGLSSLVPNERKSLSSSDALAAADLALYRAKSQGRDRVCWQLVRSQ